MIRTDRKRGRENLPVACVVLAAGLSVRFGSLKQLARISTGKKSMLQSSLDAANGSKANYVFVVLGHGAGEIMRELNPGRAQIIFNKKYSNGLSASIKSSISNLPKDCEAVVLMVADQPFVTPRLINRLIEAVRTKRAVRIARLAFKNEPRNPAILRKEFFPLLAKLEGDIGASGIMNARQDVTLINISDERVFLDVDTTSNIARIRRERDKVKSKKSKRSC